MACWAGWNFFLRKNKFFRLFLSQTKKRRESAKNNKKNMSNKAAEVLFLNAGWHPKAGWLLRKIALKCWQTTLFMHCFLLFFALFPFFLVLTEKDGKVPKNNFDQWTACGAPISWSKYTTYQQNLVGIVQISKGCGKNLKNVGQKKVFISKTNPLFILVPHNILPIPKSKTTKKIDKIAWTKNNWI